LAARGEQNRAAAKNSVGRAGSRRHNGIRISAPPLPCVASLRPRHRTFSGAGMTLNPYESPANSRDNTAELVRGDEPANSPATKVRYLVVGMAILMSLLLYLDRFAITPATDTMIRELGLSKGEFGSAIGVFFLAYALLQVPAGRLTDALGARYTLALYVLGWSLATMGLGIAQGLGAIRIMRLVLGAAQAGAYPAAAGLLKRWIPYSGRGLANSSVAMGGRVGLLLALAVTVPLMLLVGNLRGAATDNWRYVFVGFGAIGIIWSAAFVWLYRDDPRQHPWVNRAEADLIGGGESVSPAPKTSGEPFVVLQILASPQVWLMCWNSVCVNFGWIFLATWLPQFLIEKHGTYVTTHIGDKGVVAGLMTACTSIAAICGGICGGRATDVLVRRYGRAWGRRLPGMFSGLFVAALYMLVPQLTGLWTFIVAMIVIAFTIDFGLGATWASYQDISGKHVASVLGFGNMWGNLAAALFGWQIGNLAEAGWWDSVFYISATAMLLGAGGWFLFDANRPIGSPPMAGQPSAKPNP
jgi:sugar phosphate permease